ncbi:MAG: hypothetical protein ACHP7N_06315 [Caulobacterales bacterium]
MELKSVAAALGATMLAAAAFQTRAAEQMPSQSITGATYGGNPDATGVPPAAAGPMMSAPVSDLLKALMDAAGRHDWTTAKAKLVRVRAVNNPSDFDRFEIEVVSGFVAVNTGDHTGALASYKRVIASPLFATAETPQQQSAMLKNAMILSNEAGDFAGAVAFGEKLAARGAMDDTAAVALAFAYFGAGDYAKAAALAQKAIDAAVAAGKQPDDSAVQILSKSKANLH